MTKAATNRVAKTSNERRTTVSLRGPLLEAAESRANAQHGGNLSGYIQALIEKDMADAPSSVSKPSDKVIEDLSKTYRPDIAESVLKALSHHKIDQRKFLGEILGSLDVLLPHDNPIVKFISTHSPSSKEEAKKAFANTPQTRFAGTIARELMDYAEEVIGHEAGSDNEEKERLAIKRARGFLAFNEDAPRIVPQRVLDQLNQKLHEAHQVIIRALEAEGGGGLAGFATIEVSKKMPKHIICLTPLFYVPPKPYQSKAERSVPIDEDQRNPEEEAEKKQEDDIELNRIQTKRR